MGISKVGGGSLESQLSQEIQSPHDHIVSNRYTFKSQTRKNSDAIARKPDFRDQAQSPKTTVSAKQIKMKSTIEGGDKAH